ncbi:conserved hypothetical protein [Burkholderia pseudomallei MSHR346]|nr:conserved hypothetical protein [Burkholderia pseudomallei MSHR346]
MRTRRGAAVRCGARCDSGPRLHPGARPAREGVLAVATVRCRSRGGRQASTDARRGGAKCAAEPRASFPRLSACPILECSIQAPLCMPDSHARFARLGDERLDRTARNETGNRAAIAAVSSASRAPRGRRDCCKPSTGRTADYQRMRNGRL